ncbi:MAG: iron-containing alcohol dehydrogenase, partial [Anaerobacillus sp.]
MNTFLQYNPTKLFFGEDQIKQIPNELENNLNVLVVYGGGSIKQNGVYDAVINELQQVNATIFELSGVEPNPRLTTVRKGVDICKTEGIDFLLAVGGGSVIDCTKAISAGAVYEGDAWDLITQKAPINKALPFGTVLT